MLITPKYFLAQTKMPARDRPPPFPDDERETTYQAALLLVSIIDYRLNLGLRHDDTAGNRLCHLDQVVNAILEDRFSPLETR